MGLGRVRVKSGNGVVSFQIAGNPTVYDQRWQTKVADQSPMPVVVYAKARVNAVPMFIQKSGPGYPLWPLNLLARDAPCSFDLLKGDWLPPYGAGLTADVAFRWVQRGTFSGASAPFDVTLQVAFVGKGNGIVSAKSIEPGPTSMPLPRLAPLDGYADAIELRTWRTRGGRVETTIPDVDDKNRGYFFRIRTVVDDAGKVVAARYGKIVGAISFQPLENGSMPLSFWYFVSGADNDRNMEHRMDANLFSDADTAGRQRR